MEKKDRGKIVENNIEILGKKRHNKKTERKNIYIYTGKNIDSAKKYWAKKIYTVKIIDRGGKIVEKI